MTTPSFCKLTADDALTYQRFYEKSNSRITDLTLPCRIAWDPVFKNHWAVIEDCFVMMSDGGGYTRPHMLMPLGQPDSARLDRILSRVKPLFDTKNWPFRVISIEEDTIDMFHHLEHFDADISYDDDASDYIYDAQQLRDLQGGSLRKKRNHINKFMRLYPDYVYTSVKKDHADACIAMARRWCRHRGLDPDALLKSDCKMIERLFEDFDRLSVRGGMIQIHGQVEAFCLGHVNSQKCAFIHFEKANETYHGLYAVINRLALLHDFSDAVNVNREEDLGILGLRKSKLSYEPIEWRKKYRAVLLPKR